MMPAQQPNNPVQRNLIFSLSKLVGAAIAASWVEMANIRTSYRVLSYGENITLWLVIPHQMIKQSYIGM